MEIKVTDYHQNKGVYSFTIKGNKINGITGPDRFELIDIFKLKRNKKGKITVNKKDILEIDINNLKRNISIINKYLDSRLKAYKVYECMYQEMRKKRMVLKDPKRKMIDSLKIVGLDISCLTRSVKDLSTSEKKLFQLSIALMSNPEVIIIDEFLNNLDLKSEKRLMVLLEKMVEQYNKTIILVSSNPNTLYEYSSHIIITKANEVLIEGNTEEVYQNVELFKDNSIQIPEKVEWTYIAKKEKKAKIDYHKDVRDMIKDIYKHV